MSNANDETLLEDEDGEGEYDLGNEEEEALLADDDEQDAHRENISYLKKSSGRKNQYTRESNIYGDSDDLLGDDILDLDDVEIDLENTEYAEEGDFNETQDDLDADEQQGASISYQGREDHKSLIESEMGNDHNARAADLRDEGGISVLVKEEPLEMNEEVIGGRKDSEDEEEEEKDEGRGRFKSERTMVISLKGGSKTYGNIPDTLDGVITGEDKFEAVGRWKRNVGGRGGGTGFQRGGFRGNQRGSGANFGNRRKQMGQNRQGGGGMGYAHGRGEGPPDSMRDVIGPPPSQFMLSQNIHFNPHFKGNILPQPEGPPWNEGPMGNPPHPSGVGGGGGPPSHGGFHDLQRFPPPPPSVGSGYGDHRGGDMLQGPPAFGDHHRQPRQRSPPPPTAYHLGPGGRSGDYDLPSAHPDYLRDDPYDSRRPPHPGDGWNGGQRMGEGSMGGLPSGGGHHGHHHHHHGYEPFPMSPGLHGDRGGGEVLQHFRPTMQPGPLFSHVAPPSVAPPQVVGMPDQQGLMMHQQHHHHHMQNVLRSAPPLHGNGGGMGQHMMQQMPPQEQPHSRIPPPGFSPNEGRSMPSVHHGMQSPWHDPPVNRSPMGGQHLSPQQHQQQQQPPFHLSGGAPRPYLGGDRPGTIPGAPMHHHPSVGSMSAPPPPFHSGSIPQGPHPPHPMQHSPMRQNNFNSSSSTSPGGGNPGGHNNGRFPRQGNLGNFHQQPGFSRAPPPHQGVRPNRGAGHMSQGRGGLGARRGMGTPNTRPIPLSKSIGEDSFPPKRPPLQDNSSTIKVSPPKKRKVRKIVKNNLLEVETVDTLPDTTTTSDKEATTQKEPDNNAKPPEPVDAEYLEYQKQIERQKKLREEVLRRKEQRRKLMALEKQKELQEKAALSGETSSDVPKGNAIATIVNRNPVEPSPTVVLSSPIIKKEPMANQSFTAQMNPGQLTPEAQANQAQLLAARKKALVALRAARSQNPAQAMGRGMAIRGMRGGMGGGMANHQVRLQNLVTVGNAPGGGGQHLGQRTAIIQVKNEQGQMVRKKVAIRPGMAGRGGSMMGRGQNVEGSPQPGRAMVQGRGQMVVNKQGQQGQAPGGMQRVVQMLPPQQSNAQSPEPKAQANKVIQRVVKVNVPVPNQQQPQGRKVVVQNVGGPGGGGDCISSDSGVATGSVVVENLAVTTTEADLRKICMTVGRVKSIRMVPGIRSAWVEFAHPTAAATFCQRYQRKIVDLSMITG